MAAVSDQLSEERYRAKYGRYTPAQESRLKDLQAASAMPAPAPAGPVAAEERDRRSTEKHLAIHRGKCLELGQCSLMPSKTEASNAVTVASNEEARFVAKYGRSRSVPVLAAGIGSAPCEHACCQLGL